MKTWRTDYVFTIGKEQFFWEEQWKLFSEEMMTNKMLIAKRGK